ncbi:MAG: hypothetical protein IKE69_08915 [Thermoguttaceae bacterium]|nr:hypothetical protein [Thermoguttaceae bacterium]
MKRSFFLTVLAAAFTFLPTAVPAQESLPSRGICSHRGWQSEFPENTIPAFEAAVLMKAQMIEFDVRFTKDRQMVIMHDWTVDRTSDGTGHILDLTFDEVRALDFGSWKSPRFAGTKIPTLDETLAVMPRDVWLNIHLGGVPHEIAAELALAVAEKIVADNRVDQAFVACDHIEADAIKAKYPQVKICNMFRQGGSNAYIDDTIARKAEFIQLAYELPTPEQIARLKEAGIKINYFGTDDPAVMRRLFDLGVEFPLVDRLEAGMNFFDEYSREN